MKYILDADGSFALPWVIFSQLFLGPPEPLEFGIYVRQSLLVLNFRLDLLI